MCATPLGGPVDATPLKLAKSLRAAWLLLAIASVARGQQLPSSAAGYGAFAFPDAAGTRLLIVAPISEPAKLHSALCEGGRRFAVKFERVQVEVAEHNGRQTAQNFEKLAGSVFRVVEGKIESGASCFVASDELLSGGELLLSSPASNPTECEPEVRRSLASARNRPVANCWQIARLRAATGIAVVEFARQEKDALASVVLLDGDRMFFADHRAEFGRSGADLWRADDGGVFSVDGFRVVFVLRRGTAFTLGVNWMGPEGASLAVYVSSGSSLLKSVIQDYWYQAPI